VVDSNFIINHLTEIEELISGTEGAVENLYKALSKSVFDKWI
jgi:hypothetical protein